MTVFVNITENSSWIKGFLVVSIYGPNLMEKKRDEKGRPGGVGGVRPRLFFSV